jgi:hypothetical protein
MAFSQSNTVLLLLCPHVGTKRTGSESWRRYGSTAISALSGSAAILLGSAAVIL